MLPTSKALDLELMLSDGPGRERRVPMKLVDGTHRAMTTPFPAWKGPLVCKVDVKYENGSVTGTTEDRTCRIGDKEYKLSQLRSLLLGAKPQVQLTDGQRLVGKLELEPLSLEVGKQSLRLDLTGAAEVHVKASEEATVLYCTVVARQEGKEVGQSSAPLYIAGVSQPDSPADWTKDLKKSVIPDGPVTGTVMGVEFTPENIQLQNTGLNLQNGTNRIHIFLKTNPGKDVYEYKAENRPGPGRSAPAIHVHMGAAGVAVHQTGYTMRLEFGKEKDGQIPCKIYLSLPDDSKSCIAGSFTVKSE